MIMSKTAASAFGGQSKFARAGFVALMGDLFEALSTAREAEAEYHRQLSKGVEPSKAAQLALERNFKSH